MEAVSQVPGNVSAWKTEGLTDDTPVLRRGPRLKLQGLETGSFTTNGKVSKRGAR